MKLYQRLVIASALTLGIFGTSTGRAQQTTPQPVWANYDVQYVNVFYNPLAGSTLINPDAFLNFSGGIDHDDGVANNIPVGFTFDYNGVTYNSINVCVNGWVSVGTQNIPLTPNNNNNLFTPIQPNNTLAPYWGDHYYRSLEPGYRPSRISYLTSSIPDPNPNALPSSTLKVFTLEWRDLNINDKSNPNSIASFQLKIVQNTAANDLAVPDQRATIEFHYGPIGTTGTVLTTGAAVGIEDSVGATHMNGLFPSSLASEDSTRLNTSRRTDCWPPATCLPGRIIQFVPEGRANYNQWGDGDVNLTQVYDPNPVIRNNQNRFVTLADADLILQSRANNVALDSVEGRAAFHGDANHTGRVYNPTYGTYFYYVTSYDAAYILMYLAAKLPVLPWPTPLPVPGYKSTDNHSTDVSGILADAQNARVNGSTILVPVTIRGTVNGALGLEMNVSTDANAIQFVGTRAVDGTLMRSNATDGKVAFAGTGNFENGATIGYLEFNVTDMQHAGFELTNVMVNDQSLPSSKISLQLAGVTGSNATGSALEANVPNPFVVTANGHTSIGFNLNATENVTLRVYDMLGHQVRTLISDENRSMGHNTIDWDGRDASGNIVASGLYYYQLSTATSTVTHKMQVTR